MHVDVAYYANKDDKSVTGWLTNLTSLCTNVCKGIDVYTKDAENIRNVKSTALQLQKMPLPKFDGDVRKYARFKSDFSEVLKPTIVENEGTFVSKQCLSPEVR